MKEGNALFNDALNTIYLRLLGIGCSPRDGCGGGGGGGRYLSMWTNGIYLNDLKIALVFVYCTYIQLRIKHVALDNHSYLGCLGQ